MLGGDAGATVVGALNVLASPTTSQSDKLTANQILEQVKASDVATIMQIAGICVGPQPDSVQLFGYSLLCELVQKRWKECSEVQKDELATFASMKLIEVGGDNNANRAVRTSLANYCATVLSYQGAKMLESWNYILNFGKQGPYQSELVCLLSKFICEVPKAPNAGDKTSFITSLKTITPDTLQFLSKALEDHYSAMMTGKQSGDSQKESFHMKGVEAGLTALQSWCEFASKKNLERANVVRVFRALIGVTEFSSSVISNLDKVVSREDFLEGKPSGIGFGCAEILFECLNWQIQKFEHKKLDLEDLEDFELTWKIACSLGHLGKSLLSSPIAEPLNGLEEVLLKILDVFRFNCMEVAVECVQFWKDFLAFAKKKPQVPAMKRKKEAARDALNKCAPALTMRLVELYERLDALVVSADWESGGMMTGQDAKSFREQHLQNIKRCISELGGLEPVAVGSYTNTLLDDVVKAFSGQQQNVEQQLRSLKRITALVMALAPGSLQNFPDNSKKLFRKIVNAILGLNVGKHCTLALHYGRALCRCIPLVNMDGQMAASLIGHVLNMLVQMPMATRGLGPPLQQLKGSEYQQICDSRYQLCRVLVTIVNEQPETLLRGLKDFTDKVESAKNAQRLSMSEWIWLMEVAAMGAGDGAVNLQVDMANWILNPIRQSWMNDSWRNNFNSPMEFASHYMCATAQGNTVVYGGGEQRWMLYHEVKLLNKMFTKAIFPKPNDIDGSNVVPVNPLDGHMEFIPVVARIFSCIHGLWEPSQRSRLGSLAQALEMSREEAEVYVKKGPTEKKSLPDSSDASGVAGGTIASCRKWLCHLFDLCAKILGSTGKQCPLFWVHPQLSHVPEMVTANLAALDMRFSKLLLRLVICPWITKCPVAERGKWVYPVMVKILPIMHGMVGNGWQRLASRASEKGNGMHGDLEEILYEGLLREQTSEYAHLLEFLGAGGEHGSVFQGLVEMHPQTAHLVFKYVLELLPSDWSIGHSMNKISRTIVEASDKSPELAQMVCGELFPVLLKLLFDPLMEVVSPDIIYTVTEILTRYYSTHKALTEVLMKLPGMTGVLMNDLPHGLKRGPKKTKTFVRTFLVLASGGKMAALEKEASNSAMVQCKDTPGSKPPKSPSFHEAKAWDIGK